MIFTLVLIVGIVLVLNSNTLLAADLTGNAAPKITAAYPANNSVILKSPSIKVYFNKPIKAGNMVITLKNSVGKTIPIKKIINKKILTIIPLKPLPIGIKYNLILYPGSVKDIVGMKNSKYSTTFTVSPITLTQIKSGFNQVQSFYNNNLHFPSYVYFGKKKMSITKFMKILKTQGLKINTKIIDLTVTKVTAPTRWVKGNTITIPNTIKNQGNTAATGFYVRYYLKSSSTLYIGQRYISSLAAGASNSQNTKLLIPLNIPSDNYNIIVSVDGDKLVNDSKRSNNYKAASTKTLIVNARPVYITSDGIFNEKMDNARVDAIAAALRGMGLYAVNYDWGPNSHYQILKNKTVPKNALIVDLYGGACAGTIWEMTKSYYKYYKGDRAVFSVWINTNIDIGKIKFLGRAHDDNFTPVYGSHISGAFPTFDDVNKNGIFDYGEGYVNGTIYPTKFKERDGINYPAQILLSNGYRYMYRQDGNITEIAEQIFKEAIRSY
ncbi:MAG: CARDB domain-containing protein [Methanobacterium sp.]|nr:CARDB domain-containing protein [Methanobacterium sp.]